MFILITAATNSQAYKLERLLQAPDIIFADNKNISHLKYSGRKYINIPEGNSTSFAHEVLKACLDLGIEKIYPLYFDEIRALSEAKQLFDEYGIKVIVPEMEYLKKIDLRNLSSAGEFLIVEDGQVVAGETKGTLIEGLPTGIFCLQTSAEVKLFAIQHA